ncbi:hypothetical protein Xinn_01903 [Xenorhabdus innexi]|uniref:Uncharacterized protein n=1 Tax=Xenorhabdus innexi TaxID=290109 RepID=A0A2G0NMQ0_9GAMM|nr:hypothetical protein Xinn_01903 [Xenorhabdus innexi]
MTMLKGLDCLIVNNLFQVLYISIEHEQNHLPINHNFSDILFIYSVLDTVRKRLYHSILRCYLMKLTNGLPLLDRYLLLPPTVRHY